MVLKSKLGDLRRSVSSQKTLPTKNERVSVCDWVIEGVKVGKNYELEPIQASGRFYGIQSNSGHWFVYIPDPKECIIGVESTSTAQA